MVENMDRERLHPDDICAGTIKPRTKVGPAPSQPIHLASVYECNSPEEADAILAGQQPGYVYARDGHPNGETLAGTLARLHRAQRAIVTATGMAALGTAALSQLRSETISLPATGFTGEHGRSFARKPPDWELKQRCWTRMILVRFKVALPRKLACLLWKHCRTPC